MGKRKSVEFPEVPSLRELVKDAVKLEPMMAMGPDLVGLPEPELGVSRRGHT